MRLMRKVRQRVAAVFVLGFIALVAQYGAAAEKAIVEARLAEDMRFLTSAQCEGRGIFTQGINVAADYIARDFQKSGLKPAGENGGYFQSLTATGAPKLGSDNRLVLRGPLGQTIALEMGKQFNVVAFGAAGKVSAPVVFAGYGITATTGGYDDYSGLDVAGKVVMVLRRTPHQGNSHLGDLNKTNYAALQTKAANAEIHKAAAVIFVNDSVSAESRDQLMDFSYTTQGFTAVGLPMVHLTRSYANRMLRSVLDSDLNDIEKAIDREIKPRSLPLGGWTCEIETNVTRTKTPIKNVVGVLEGSGPLANETVIIGAHYDHLGFGGPSSLARGSTEMHPGADDNASGTASLMELARRFAAQPARQGRRLVFIAFSGEESGLFGSIHYCKNPIFSLADTVTMINMDMVGRLRDDKLTIYGTDTAKVFAGLLDKLNQAYQFKITRAATSSIGFGNSDHVSFYNRNIPVFHFFTGLHGEYHRPTDKFETVNVPGVGRITDMIEELAQHLRTMPARPEFVKVAGAGLSAAMGTSGRGPRLGIMPDYNDDKEGVRLEGVSEGAPAARAGLKTGDRIIDIAGKPVKNLPAYMAIMSGMKKGDKFDVTVIRDGKQQKLSVVLE